MSWDERLTPEEREDWERFVRHTREHTVKGMMSSAFVMSLVPNGEPDIKFAVELGLAIMLDKPIIAIVMKGASCPERLRSVVDGVVELEEDFDTEAGKQQAMDKLRPYIDRFAK